MIEDAADTAFFHAALKAACDRHDPGYYPRFKAWADEYFLIRHWNEPRGVGGIFFDDLCDRRLGGGLRLHPRRRRGVPRRASCRSPSGTCAGPWTEAEREIQLVKRGRYAEFNLVYDRGTKFGLETGHNPEAVLMSLPPVAKWP